MSNQFDLEALNQSIGLHRVARQIEAGRELEIAKLSAVIQLGLKAPELPRDWFTSIDGATALIEVVRPGSYWYLAKGRNRPNEPLFGASINHPGEDDPLAFGESNIAPGLAIIAALLKAAAHGQTERPARPERGSGITTRQIEMAPEGALYVVHDRDFEGYVEAIAAAKKKTIRPAPVYRLGLLMGLTFPGIVIDHNVWLTDGQYDSYERLLPYVRPQEETVAA
ncbi:MAG TPA: hypothetical protein VE986_06275 [Hyphomicrobiales bacterium]|nr:hypothetical protein [Hyphomicrobiales bacterium]